MEGWIKLHRQIVEHPDYFSEPFTRVQAWIDLLIMANHKGKNLRVRGNMVSIKRGQTAMAQETLATRWKWSRGKVKRFLYELENNGQIVQQKSSIITCITIVNYNTYQDDDTTDDTSNGTADGRQTVQQTDINKNEKNVKNNYSLSNAREQISPDDGVVTETLEELEAILSGSGQWLEQVAINRGLKSGEEAVNWLQKFFGELRIRGDTTKTLQDTKQHFVSWLKIQLDQQKRQKHDNGSVRKIALPEGGGSFKSTI